MFGFKNLNLLVVVGALCFTTTLVYGDELCNTPLCRALSKKLLTNMNTTADPCDDFYVYACGNYAKHHPLAPEVERLNSFTERNDEVEHEINDAINSAVSSSSHTVHYLSQLYQQCNQTALLEKRGVKPLLDAIDGSVGNWPILRKHNKAGKKWTEIFPLLVANFGLSPIFALNVQMDRRTEQNYITLFPGGTGISYGNLLQPAYYQKVIDAYKTYIRNTAILMGAPDDDQLTHDVNAIVRLETKIAEALEESPLNLIRKTNFGTLTTATHHRIDWLSTLNTILNSTHSTLAPLHSNDILLVANAEFIVEAVTILDETLESTVQNLFGWLVAQQFGSLTTDKFRQNEAEYKSVITGVHKPLPHWESCYNLANSKLPFALSRVYVDKHFTSADKKEATVLIEEIKSAFRSILKQNQWLDEQTRELALEKLDAIKVNVGYPDWILNNQELDSFYDVVKNAEVTQGKFLESVLHLQTLSVKSLFDHYHSPAHNLKQQWPMTPSTVNAAYMPTQNSITIPAAVLKPPFFDRLRPFGMNYGAIGAIIGHEMTHGFDNNGRQFDKYGEQKNWWTQKTLEEFTEKANCFVVQYGKIYDPLAEMNVNGRQTLGENIADNGGVKESYYAFQSHQKKYGKAQKLPGIDLNADQLFFLSYANNWCSVTRKEILQRLILIDPHTPDRYRVNVPLENSKEFAQTFHCASGTRMNPQDKCSVW